MPYVKIEITDGATTEQKLEIYKGVTELLGRVLNKKPEYTFVVIQEIASEDWGHFGTSVAELRSRQAAEAKAASEKPAGKSNAKPASGASSGGAKATPASSSAAKPAAAKASAAKTATGSKTSARGKKA